MVKQNESRGAYQSASSPPPSSSKPTTAAPITSPTPFAEPSVVTLLNAVSIAIPRGTVVLQPGTKLPFVSRDKETVRVRYFDGADYDVPLWATDLK